MAKQRRYIDDFSLKLRENVLEGNTTRSYFTKNDFSFSEDFNKYSEELKFDSISSNCIFEMTRTDSDFERGKLLYESLKHLTRREASDIGLWNYLSHNELYKVVHRMWPDIENPPNNSTSESYILNHWIMTSSAQSALMDYPLSSLWWSFFLTVDEKRTDKYELTSIFFKNLTFRTKSFGQSKIARNKEAVIGVLEFILENKLDEKNLEDSGAAITPYLNLLGGTRPLGAFDSEWFKQKLTNKFQKDIKEYGRLFRRDDKNSNLLLTNSKQFNPTTPTKGGNGFKEVIELGKNNVEFIFIKNNSLSIRNTSFNPTDYNLEVDLKDRQKSLYIIFNNGYVKKFSSLCLDNLSRDQEYIFGNSSSKVINIFYSFSNDLILACFLNTLGKKALKIYPSENISNQRFIEKGVIISAQTRDLKVVLIPNSYKQIVPSLIKDYPEGAFLFESKHVEVEINKLKKIIDDNQMFSK